MRKVKQVVNLLEDTINMVLNDELDTKKANTIGYLSNQIIRAIETSELEKRVQDLEKTLKSQKKENVIEKS